MTELKPNITPPAALARSVRSQGFAVLDLAALCEVVRVTPHELDSLRASWDDLPPDAHLRDGGRYRRRRHASFVIDGDRVNTIAHRAHWQPLEYNALHGGLERWFEPITARVLDNRAWTRLLSGLANQCSLFADHEGGAKLPWFVEAHQFRIDTTDGIGRPTPEGAHRDGVDYVAVILIDRVDVKGGETRVFEADGPNGLRFTMVEPWTTLILDDARVIHESTPIQPTADGGHRDTLVLTFRAGGFQDRT